MNLPHCPVCGKTHRHQPTGCWIASLNWHMRNCTPEVHAAGCTYQRMRQYFDLFCRKENHKCLSKSTE